MSGAAANPLLIALEALVSADPERGASVLRKAIAALVADDARKMGRPSGKDATAWAGTRARLRAAMAADKLTAMQLGQSLGLSESSVDKCAAPAGPVPSAAIGAKIEAWLAARTKIAAPLPAEPPAAVNGHVPETPSAPAGVAILPASGPGAHAHAGKLTRDQRSALIGHLGLMKSERLVREAFGLTRELADKAAAGQAVPVEAVARIATFLAG